MRKEALKKALAHAFVGFVSGYTVGLQATQALNVAVLSGLISAAAYFMYEVLK
jgi:predicted RND superfamily exporter protein